MKMTSWSWTCLHVLWALAWTEDDCVITHFSHALLEPVSYPYSRVHKYGGVSKLVLSLWPWYHHVYLSGQRFPWDSYLTLFWWASPIGAASISRQITQFKAHPYNKHPWEGVASSVAGLRVGPWLITWHCMLFTGQCEGMWVWAWPGIPPTVSDYTKHLNGHSWVKEAFDLFHSMATIVEAPSRMYTSALHVRIQEVH